MKRQQQLLAGLAVLLVASLIYAFWAMPRQEQAAPGATAVSKKAVAARKTPGQQRGAPTTDRLQLELLEQEVWPFPGVGRDIFRLQAPAPAAVAPDSVAALAEAPPPPPPPPPPTPEEILSKQVTAVVFLGFVEAGGVRTVFLSVDGQRFLVKPGGAFGPERALVLKAVNDKELVIGWQEGPETVHVQVTENRPLAPSTGSGGLRAGKPGQRATMPAGGATALSRRALLPPRLPVPTETAEEPDEEPEPEQEPPAPGEKPSPEGLPK